MLTETIASAILMASITGAGLVLTIYALITPISSKMFQKRIELLQKKKQKFDELKGKINSESSDKDFKQLKELRSEIREVKAFPKYLGVGILLVFVLYIITTLSSTLWLSTPSRHPIQELYVVGFFLAATFGFLAVGVVTVFDVSRTMIAEFEEMKKQQEEVEKVSKELERFKKKLKPKYTKSQ